MTDVLEIRELSISTVDGQELIWCHRLSAGRGSIVAVVGPSGSGKTTLLRAIAGALPTGVTGLVGSLRVLDTEPLTLPTNELRAFRRRHIGFVGQDPASRLNPRMQVRRMLAEAAGNAPADPGQVLTEVGLPDTDEVLRRRPGHLSGGQQRRVALARALIRQPDLLLLDEPTVGLDTALRERLAALLRERADERGTTIVLACHDLSLVDRLADDVVDLDPGEQHSTPVRSGPPAPAATPAVAELLRVHGLSAWPGSRSRNPILTDVELSLPAGGALAVVGVSGAGKTTLARAITGLHHNTRGQISIGGEPLPLRTQRRSRAQRGRIQLVPQDPLGTLNPSRTVGATLRWPLRLHRRSANAEIEVTELLDTVGLSAEFTGRYPHELSGGQRQRVAIARALAADPDVLICDEITSALDAPTAAAVLSLLDELRIRRNLALIMITHEMSIAAQHTDQVLVLDGGRVVEQGSTPDVLARPNHPATAALCGTAELAGDHTGQSCGPPR